MRITPRGPEVKAIVDLLESTEYESAEALAKAIIKRTGDLLAERDWYGWFYQETPEAFILSWGPFSSDSEARRFAAKYVGMLKGRHMILPLHSTTGLVNRMASYKIPSQFCSDCNHSLISHEHPKIQPKCAVRRCKCRKATT